MNGYKIRLILYSSVTTWREFEIPKDISFKQLHILIQKAFGFEDYHNYEFRVPEYIAEEDAVDLNTAVKTINYTQEETNKIDEILDENSVLLYVYYFGCEWEIIIEKTEDIDYKYKTALLTDYKGKYNPSEDIGMHAFERIAETLYKEDNKKLDNVLEEFYLTRGEISSMRFEKKYKKGSKIRLN